MSSCDPREPCGDRLVVLAGPARRPLSARTVPRSADRDSHHDSNLDADSDLRERVEDLTALVRAQQQALDELRAVVLGRRRS
ncbi:MAG: hypothetical protein M3Q27_06140 [Actinomycetota bacterium]|nr:hypothetical protein [Actinomycetota bacterium]